MVMSRREPSVPSDVRRESDGVTARGGSGWFDAYRRRVEQDRAIPGVWKWLHYFDVYERHLERFRGTLVHVVEAGVASGGSLRMWREYFGKNATITGVDISPRVLRYEGMPLYGRPNKMFCGDLRKRAFREQLIRELGRVDVFLEDASHEPADQIANINDIVPHVAPKGVYLVEDVEGNRQSANIEVQRFVFENFIASFSLQDAEAKAHGRLAPGVAGIQRNAGLNHLVRAGKIARTQIPNQGKGLTSHLHNSNESDVQRLLTSVTFYPFVIAFERAPAVAPRMAAPMMGRWSMPV